MKITTDELVLLITILFVLIKLTGINVSWWVVLSPGYVYIVYLFVIAEIVLYFDYD